VVERCEVAASATIRDEASPTTEEMAIAVRALRAIERIPADWCVLVLGIFGSDPVLMGARPGS